jgi:hypothetical protein
MPSSPSAGDAIEPAETAPCVVCKEQDDHDGIDGGRSFRPWG